MQTPEPIGQQGRWLDFFAEFDLDIIHRACKNHNNSDALSCRPCERGTTADCPQCVRGTAAGVTTTAGDDDSNPRDGASAEQATTSSLTGFMEEAHESNGSTGTRDEINSVLSPTATPFYPANDSRRDIAESQESVSTLDADVTHVNPVKWIIIHYDVSVTEFATNRSELEPTRLPAEPLPKEFEGPVPAQSYRACRRQQDAC